jgi:hypothetical protein
MMQHLNEYFKNVTYVKIDNDERWSSNNHNVVALVRSLNFGSDVGGLTGLMSAHRPPSLWVQSLY